MKKLTMPWRARAAAVLTAILIALPSFSAALAETYALVSGTQTLNLRQGPASSSQWLGAYPLGTWVTVTGAQNNFYAVHTADGKSGYMSKNFLSTTDQLACGDVAIVTNQRESAFLNLRSFPSYSASVITILYNGVPLTVLSSSDGWYRVQMGETVGYVRGEYVTLSNQRIGTAVGTIKTPNNTAVNMRTAPFANASVRRQFAGDRYVSVLYRGVGWWYVCIDGYTGFISSDYLVQGLHAARDGASPQPAESYALVHNPSSTHKLNLRNTPSTGGAIVARLANGYRLSVIAQGTEWCRVFTSTLAATGYVQTRYLSLYNLPVTPKVTIIHPQGSYVNLRGTASMSGSVTARVPNGTQVVMVAPGPEWSKVKYGSKVGYVLNYFISTNTGN